MLQRSGPRSYCEGRLKVKQWYGWARTECEGWDRCKGIVKDAARLNAGAATQTTKIQRLSEGEKTLRSIYEMNWLCRHRAHLRGRWNSENAGWRYVDASRPHFRACYTGGRGKPSPLRGEIQRLRRKSTEPDEFSIYEADGTRRMRDRVTSTQVGHIFVRVTRAGEASRRPYAKSQGRKPKARPGR